MGKNNIRSFRYSDEVAEVLESFEGESMNAKFENLVMYCFSEVPKREKIISELDGKIDSRRDLLFNLTSRCSDIDKMVIQLNLLKTNIENLSKSPALIQEKLENM